MMRRLSPLIAGLLIACSVGTGRQTSDVAPTPRTEWSMVIAQASQEASAGRFAAADRVLADFITKYPASGESVESMYWRALYKLDPSNPAASPREAGVLLDTYMSSANAAHRAEAAALRRIAGALESRPAAATATAKPADTPATDKAKDDEIARLKDELAKANAELDRIKKRLAQPTKP